MSEYRMEKKDDMIIFHREEEQYRFGYEVHDIFFILTSFSYENEDCMVGEMDFVVTKGKEKEKTLGELFHQIHDFSKEKGCEVIFTSIFSTNLFYTIRTDLRYRILPVTQRKWLKKALPSLFAKDATYYYWQIESFHLSHLIENIVMFSHHFTRDLKETFPLFDHNDLTEEFYYEGHTGTFSYEVKQGTLYITESSAKMCIPFTRNEEEMKKAMTPYFEKWKQKGRIRNTLNPSLYFTKRYFKEQTPILYHQDMIPMIQNALPFSEKELETLMYRTCNCYDYEITALKRSTFTFLFQIKDSYFVVGLIPKHVAFFQDEKEAHKAFTKAKENQKKTV